jgi:hypothetical protein
MKRNMMKIVMMMAVVMVAVFTYPTRLETQAALSEPSTYNYKYKARDIGGYSVFVFETPGGFGYEPKYTRIIDGSYYNYTTTIDNTLYTPFPITLTFTNSNTDWYDTGSGYIPYDTAFIGSDNTVGYLCKIHITFKNNTNKNYVIYYDMSSTMANQIYHHRTNNTYIILPQFQWNAPINQYNSIYINAYTNIELFVNTSSTTYLDAFYLRDLGVSSSYLNGYSTGEYDGYQDGYAFGNEEGYLNGTIDYFNGDSLLVDEYPYTESAPYFEGFGDGGAYYEQAYQDRIGLFGLLSGAMAVPISFMMFEILPGITIGGLALLPLVFSVLFFLFKVVFK